jgi:hypothetical protein
MDFQERALTARVFGAPYNKTDGVLLWQNSKHDMFEYQGGVFMNTGTNGTRINLSGLPTGMVRVLMRPLIGVAESLTMSVVNPAWAPLVAFSVLIVILLRKPVI